MTTTYAEPQTLRPTSAELEKASKTTKKISIRGDTCYRLRFFGTKLGVEKLTYDQIIKLLLASQEIGAPLGKLRSHPKIVAILGHTGR